MIDVTYGILNYNPLNDTKANEYLENCLQTLADNRNTSISSEVYIIDQNSHPNALRNIHGNQFNFIQLGKNLGISGGINALSRMARGKYISLVTSDTTFTQELDTVLLEELETYQDIYQITPAVDKGSIDYQIKGFTDSKEPIRCIAQELTIQFWRREIFDLIGYWDERWLACYECLDYPLRMFLTGRCSAAVTHKIACHHEHNTTTHNGAMAHAFGGTFEHGPLRNLWDHKWPGLDWDFLYNLNKYNEQTRSIFAAQHFHNIKLPWNALISLNT